MAVGTITSILAGVSFPFFLMYFGQITDIFIDKEFAAEKGFNIFIKFFIIGAVYWTLSKYIIIKLFHHFTHGATQAQLKV